MGWVEERFAAQELIKRQTPLLWQQMRDSIGAAVTEYNTRVAETDHGLTLTDCSAREYCRRIEKKKLQPLRYVEVFLDVEGNTLSIFTFPGNTTTIVCGYAELQDNSQMRFFMQKGSSNEHLSADEACELALEDFLFNPFPRP